MIDCFAFEYGCVKYIWFIQKTPSNRIRYNDISLQPFQKIGYVINYLRDYDTRSHVEYIKRCNKNPNLQVLPQIPLSIQSDGCGTVHICKYINDFRYDYSLTASSISYLFKIMIKRWRNRKLKQLVKSVLYKDTILKTYDGDNSITNHILEYVTIF